MQPLPLTTIDSMKKKNQRKIHTTEQCRTAAAKKSDFDETSTTTTAISTDRTIIFIQFRATLGGNLNTIFLLTQRTNEFRCNVDSKTGIIFCSFELCSAKLERKNKVVAIPERQRERVRVRVRREKRQLKPVLWGFYFWVSHRIAGDFEKFFVRN